MAAYKPGKTSVHIAAGQSAEDTEIIQLADEYASLRNEPLGSAVKRFLRETLPQKIAELRGQVKPNSAA